MSTFLVLYAVFLVTWGNVTSRVLGTTAWLPGGSWSFIAAGAVLAVASLAAARAMSLDASALGLAGSPVRGAILGLAIGTVVAAVGVAFLRLAAPAITGRPIEYAPLAAVTADELTRHIAFFLPLGDIFAEELAFRGVLLGGLLRRHGTALSVGLAGLVFALWHVATVVVTVGDTTLGAPSLWFLPAVAGALLVVLVGGALFAVLRVRTRSLATTVAAHWSFNAVVLVGLWSTRAPAPSGCC